MPIIGENIVETANILGVRFNAITLDDAVDAAMERIRAGEKGYVVTPNSEIVYLCRKEPALTDLLNRACLVLPDGIGVVYAARLLKQPIKGKVAGIDFAEHLVAQMAREGKSIFFLGAKPGIAELAAKELQKKYPGLVVKGCRDGYYKDDQEAIDAINQAGGADVALICLGAPKQERFMAAYQGQVNATILCGLGGSLDVFAGTVQRAPDIFIKLGLEWFYRLLKEPKRIGRMMSLPKFMLVVLKTKLFGKGAK